MSDLDGATVRDPQTGCAYRLVTEQGWAELSEFWRLKAENEKLRKALREAAEALPDPMSPRIGGRETAALLNALKIIYDALGEE